MYCVVLARERANIKLLVGGRYVLCEVCQRESEYQGARWRALFIVWCLPEGERISRFFVEPERFNLRHYQVA